MPPEILVHYQRQFHSRFLIHRTDFCHCSDPGQPIPLTLGSRDISQALPLLLVWPFIASICLCPQLEVMYVYGIGSYFLQLGPRHLEFGQRYCISVCFPCLVPLPSSANKATYSLWVRNFIQVRVRLMLHQSHFMHYTCFRKRLGFRLDQVLSGTCYSELSKGFLFFLREFLDCQCLLAHQSPRDEETRDIT